MSLFRSSLFSWVIAIALAAGFAQLMTDHSPKVIIGGLGALALTIIALKASEEVLPVLVLLTMALGSSYRWDLVSQSFYLRFYLLALVAFRGIHLFFQAKQMNKPVSQHGMTPAHFLFSLTAFAGLAFSFGSVDPVLSAQRALTFLLLYFVVFVYFWLRSETSADTQRYAASLWQSTSIILGIGYLMLLVNRGEMFNAGRLRLVLMNPNMLGHFCALMAPIVAWHLFEPKREGERRIWLRWGLLGLLALSLVWSGSRGALLTTTLTLAFQFALCYRKRLVFFILALSFLGSIHFLMGDSVPRPDEDPSFFQEHLLRQATLATGSGRSEIWDSAWDLIQRKPFLGYGFGVTDRLFALGYFPVEPDFQGGHVHNSYLEELLNLGWVGATPLFLAFAFLWVVGFSSLLAPTRITQSYRLTVALFCVVLAGTMSGVFESWFTSVGSIFCFPFWLCAILFLKMVRHFNDWSRSPVLR